MLSAVNLNAVRLYLKESDNALIGNAQLIVELKLSPRHSGSVPRGGGVRSTSNKLYSNVKDPVRTIETSMP